MFKIEEIDGDGAKISYKDLTLNIDRNQLPENAQEGDELNLATVTPLEPIQETCGEVIKEEGTEVIEEKISVEVVEDEATVEMVAEEVSEEDKEIEEVVEVEEIIEEVSAVDVAGEKEVTAEG